MRYFLYPNGYENRPPSVSRPPRPSSFYAAKITFQFSKGRYISDLPSNFSTRGMNTLKVMTIQSWPLRPKKSTPLDLRYPIHYLLRKTYVSYCIFYVESAGTTHHQIKTQESRTTNHEENHRTSPHRTTARPDEPLCSAIYCVCRPPVSLCQGRLRFIGIGFARRIILRSTAHVCGLIVIVGHGHGASRSR